MSKTLVIFYSAQGHTKKIAEQIADNLSADIFEIIPDPKYTEDNLDWTDKSSRASLEYADETKRDMKFATSDIPNWSDYDTVLIGYPIWWGIAAWPASSFVKTQDFTGKTIIPFCVSHSSPLGDSAKLLRQDAPTGTWREGHRFYQDADSTNIDAWTDGLTI